MIIIINETAFIPKKVNVVLFSSHLKDLSLSENIGISTSRSMAMITAATGR